jgi:hypothetical protein
MKKWMFVFSVVMIFFYGVPAQTTQPPTSSPSPSTTNPNQPSSGSGGRAGSTTTERRERARIDAAFENLRSLEIVHNAEESRDRVMIEKINPLYRRPSKKELKNLSPSQALLTQYEQFLRQPETGIFKLSADSSCAANVKVVVATESCLSNDIPGSGTAYSFRVKSHRMVHLSDLILDKDVIKTESMLQQGLMVNLGNTELNEVSAQTAGLKYLFDFKPANNEEELFKNDEKLNKSVKSEGFTYNYGFYAKDQTTYALRSIAYRGKVLRSVGNVKYNEMDFDKRRDVVVVFRIVEKSEKGDITILWKEISRQDSPVIKISEKDK